LVTAAGELALRDTDLTPLDSQGLFGAPLGTHEITAVAVASDDDVIVGTAAGDLFRFAYNSGPGTLVQQGSPLTGLGRVLDIDFMNATGGGGGTPGDFDGDGDIDGDDFLEWQRVDGTPAGLTEWQNNYPTVVLAAGVGAVPEPTAAFLLCAGMTILGTMRSRRFQ